VINTNLHPISDHFHIIADNLYQIYFRQGVHLQQTRSGKFSTTKFDKRN